MSRATRVWILLVLGYLALAALLMWPVWVEPGEVLLGSPGKDQADTAWLHLAAARTLVGRPVGLFEPVGFSLATAVPNWVDHLTAAPLVLALPWPLADNLWWLLVLAANGVAGHHLGRQLGGSHGAGALCGVGLALSEPVLREASWSHAPQAMVLWSPLFVLALVRTLQPEGRVRHALVAGVFLALSALTYWYQGLFLSVLAAPAVAAALVRARREGWSEGLHRRLGLGVAVVVGLCSLPLWLTLQAAPELATPSELVGTRQVRTPHPAIPKALALASTQGSGPGWWLPFQGAERANRLSLVLVLAAILGGRRSRTRWPWVVAAALGGLLLMGPYLQFQGRPVEVAGHLVPLPGAFLARIDDSLVRLTWPQRWGIVVPLALLPLAARAPRPWLLAGLLVVETALLSTNAPLPTAHLGGLVGWRSLGSAAGPVLVLPQQADQGGASDLGLVYRASGASLVNRAGLPPWVQRPAEHEAFLDELALWKWWGSGHSGPLPEQAWEQLHQAGIAAVALDLTPGISSSPEELEDQARILAAELGPPVDHGSVMVWWVQPPVSEPPPMDEPGAWRRAQHQRLVQRDGLRHRKKQDAPRPEAP